MIGRLLLWDPGTWRISLQVPDPAEIAPISFEKDYALEPMHNLFQNGHLPPELTLCSLPDSCNI